MAIKPGGDVERHALAEQWNWPTVKVDVTLKEDDGAWSFTAKVTGHRKHKALVGPIGHCTSGYAVNHARQLIKRMLGSKGTIYRGDVEFSFQREPEPAFVTHQVSAVELARDDDGEACAHRILVYNVYSDGHRKVAHVVEGTTRVELIGVCLAEGWPVPENDDAYDWGVALGYGAPSRGS